jgi:mannose/fructose-specific phosphotransferase system component IIA
MDGTIALHETCSHSPHCPRALAHALREAALHVFNDCGGDVLALDVQAHAEPEDTSRKRGPCCRRSPRRPLLVLTDVFGATPAMSPSAWWKAAMHAW